MANHDNLVSLAIFEEHNIRQIWHEDNWYFSIVDVVKTLTGSTNPSAYWRKLKQRLNEEKSQVVTDCHGLKLPASDGKMRETDCADTATMLRLIQSIPSPQAEPFKQWLAAVGSERLQELEDPDAGFEEWRKRAILSYMSQGYSEDWAAIRVDSITAHNKLTHEWSVRGIEPYEAKILTNKLNMGTFGLSVQDHMDFKEYPVIYRGNIAVHQGTLRKGMTATELALATFGDNLASAQHIENDSHGIAEITRDVEFAAEIAGENRRLIEKRTGKPVVSKTNMNKVRDGGLWGMLPDPDEA